MKPLHLNKEISFAGRAMFGDTWHEAFVRIRTGLDLELFINDSEIYSNKEMPIKIEGNTEDWTITAYHCLKATYEGFFDFSSLAETLMLSANLVEAVSLDDRDKTWCLITVRAKVIDFMRNGWSEGVPEEWGVAFYPEDMSKALVSLLHEGSRNPYDLPRIFANVDSSLYFKNRQSWSVASMIDRIDLFTSSMTLFSGTPLSYTALIGRDDRDAKFIRVNFISNPKSFICPSVFSGHAYIRDASLEEFKIALQKMIDQIYNDPDKKKIAIILSYYEELFTAVHEETRIAFSFQLMESLAHYRHIPIKNSVKNAVKEDLLKKLSKNLCPSCLAFVSKGLQPETDDFDQFIGKALDVIGTDDNFRLNPVFIKEIAKRYRNEVFHGNFFEDMAKVDEMVAALPESYKNNLTELLQAATAVLGAHFLLGLDFNSLTALKRQTSPSI